MRTLFFFIAVFLFHFSAFTQNCDCASQFHYIKNYYEANNPAFQKIKLNPQELELYNLEVEKIELRASKQANSNLCNIYFDEYLALLKDHHSSVNIKLQRVVDLSTAAKIDSFKLSAGYTAFEKRSIDTLQIEQDLANKALGDIEGIYFTESKIKIAIVKTSENAYEGIVMRKNKLLDVGHVLLNISAKSEGTYTCIYNVGLLGFNFDNAYFAEIKQINGCIPLLGFCKKGNYKDADKWKFQEIDKNTYYLKLKSFDYQLKPELDSLYSAILPLISQKKYLIIDLRDNGGGSEANYFRLLPLIYTKPLQIDEVEVWVSPDNIKAYENYQSDNEDLVARMKNAAPYSFIKLKDDAASTLELESTKFPKKIIVLQNRNTASSAEGFITYALQSDKVITLGENTGGFIGYGNVMTHEVPCGKFVIHSTTTRYARNYKYEFVGIPPMYALPAHADWIKEAIKKCKE